MARIIATQLSLAALFAGLFTIPAVAADKCYQKVYVPAQYKCNTRTSGLVEKSFDDFSNGACQTIAARVDDVEVECPKVGRWVNATFTNKTITMRSGGGRDGGGGTYTQTISVPSSQAETCSSAGLSPAKLEGQYICASGEARPVSGTDYEKISYKYGRWGDGGWAGVATTDNNYLFCWGSGQKRDNDATDRVVAWYCE